MRGSRPPFGAPLCLVVVCSHVDRIGRRTDSRVRRLLAGRERAVHYVPERVPQWYVAGTTFPGTPVNGVTITVNTGATVGTGAGPSLFSSAGTTSVVNNQGAISDLVTNTAISLGGGSTVTNAASATGGITGIISLARRHRRRQIL